MNNKFDMTDNWISFSCFGKQKGFTIFLEKGNLFNKKWLKETYYDYIQLSIDYSKSLVDEDPLLQVVRFRDKSGSDYTIVSLFRPFLDAFGRDSYYGASVIFKDCLPKYLVDIQDITQKLLKYSSTCVKETDLSSSAADVEVSELVFDIEIEPYNYDYSILKNEEVLVDCFPDSDYFFTKLFTNQIGSSRKVYFVNNVDSFTNLRDSGITTKKYEYLSAEIAKSWEDKMYREREKHLDELNKIEKLKSSKKDLDSEIKKKTSELDELISFVKEEKLLLEEYSDKKNAIVSDIGELSKELSKLKKTLNSNRKKVVSINESLQNVVASIDEHVSTIDELNQFIKTIKKNFK